MNQIEYLEKNNLCRVIIDVAKNTYWEIYCIGLRLTRPSPWILTSSCARTLFGNCFFPGILGLLVFFRIFRKLSLNGLRFEGEKLPIF